MRTLPALILISTLLSSSAHAADWHPLIGAEGLDIHIDLDSVVPTAPGLLKGWVLHTYAESKKSTIYPLFEYKTVIQLYYFNCAERTSGVAQETFYSDDARQIPVKSNSYSRKNLILDDVVPGSVGEGALEFACAWSKRAKKK